MIELVNPSDLDPRHAKRRFRETDTVTQAKGLLPILMT